MSAQRVLVCGGRDYDDHIEVGRVLRSYKPKPWNAVSEHIIIHGGVPDRSRQARR